MNGKILDMLPFRSGKRHVYQLSLLLLIFIYWSFLVNAIRKETADQKEVCVGNKKTFNCLYWKLCNCSHRNAKIIIFLKKKLLELIRPQ